MSTSAAEDPSRGNPAENPPPNRLPDKPAPASPPRRLSRTKRLVFSIIALILSWLVCETGGYFLYWYWFGRPFSWVQAQKQRRDRVEHAEGMSGTVFSEVHPYVGYVETPNSESGVRRSADGQIMPISEFG